MGSRRATAETVEIDTIVGVAETEATVDAEDRWVADAAAMVEQTLYPLADSWYMGSNVAGKPRVRVAWVGGIAEYRRICDEVAAEGYRGFALRAPVTA